MLPSESQPLVLKPNASLGLRFRAHILLLIPRFLLPPPHTANHGSVGDSLRRACGYPLNSHADKPAKPSRVQKSRCLTDNRDVYEQLMLRRVRDDKVAIQSVRNGRFLQVRSSGECVFDPKEPGEWELFTMETDSDCALYFVSCHTGNVLQCDDGNAAKCANQNRLEWEAWRILEPRATTGINQLQRRSDRRFVLEGKDRREFILELARCGKTPDEIEKIVMTMFDSPAETDTAHSAVAVPVDKE